MHQNLLFKIFLVLFFYSQAASAQNTPLANANSTFNESNLENKSSKTQAGEAANPTTQIENPEKKSLNATNNLIKNATLLDKISGSVSEVFLGKKITSLMFDEEENSNIERAIESFRNNQVFNPGGLPVVGDGTEKTEQEKIEENEKSYLYLASIIYFSPKDWAIWINEQKITPDNNKRDNEIYVKEVSRDNVSFLWKLSISKWKILSGKVSEELAPRINKQNQVEINFTLKQNQTFILSTKSVVEGKAVVALLKKRAEEKKAAEDAKNKGATPATPNAETPAPASTASPTFTQ
jgi:hypothetical protein